MFFFLPDIPHLRPKPVYITTARDNENIYSTKIPYMAARVVFIKWIVTFFLEKTYLTTAQNTKNGGDILPKIMQVCHSSSFYIFICIYYHTLTHMKYLIIRVIGSCRLLVMRPQFLCVLSKMPRFHKKLELEALVFYWHCHDEAVLKVRGGILRR